MKSSLFLPVPTNLTSLRGNYGQQLCGCPAQLLPTHEHPCLCVYTLIILVCCIKKEATLYRCFCSSFPLSPTVVYLEIFVHNIHQCVALFFFQLFKRKEFFKFTESSIHSLMYSFLSLGKCMQLCNHHHSYVELLQLPLCEKCCFSTGKKNIV